MLRSCLIFGQNMGQFPTGTPAVKPHTYSGVLDMCGLNNVRKEEKIATQDKLEKLKKKLEKLKSKFTVCIKSNEGVAVDAKKVKSIITDHGIQVTKANVNRKNGDLHVELPSKENQEELLPLLTEEIIPGNKVVTLKQKSPTISIRGVEEYSNEEEFLMRVKNKTKQSKKKWKVDQNL